MRSRRDVTKPAKFEYVRPATVPEALAALDRGNSRVLAGGQSLVPMMNFRLVQPDRLVDINRIAELGRIERTERGVRIGALVRHAEAEDDALLAGHFPIVAEAMSHVAHVAIRNRGTVAGSLCHADPSAEWPLLATLLDGEIEILGREGRRAAAPGDFFVAPLVTALEDGELATGLHLPLPDGGAATAFDEVSLRAGDFALAAAGALVRAERGRFAEVRLALGGVSDTPVRVDALERALVGEPATAAAIETVLPLSTCGLEPADDPHASGAYRLSLVPVLARRVLTRAAETALR
ncbi:MAG: xanthine dehydrogenase family protein subunit M [Defluviicoccus sp.]|nr:xanthine dehydrogenase family protein subunit M [Defluviicoccus sp.]